MRTNRLRLGAGLCAALALAAVRSQAQQGTCKERRGREKPAARSITCPYEPSSMASSLPLHASLVLGRR